MNIENGGTECSVDLLHFSSNRICSWSVTGTLYDQTESGKSNMEVLIYLSSQTSYNAVSTAKPLFSGFPMVPKCNADCTGSGKSNMAATKRKYLRFNLKTNGFKDKTQQLTNKTKHFTVHSIEKQPCLISHFRFGHRA